MQQLNHYDIVKIKLGGQEIDVQVKAVHLYPNNKVKYDFDVLGGREPERIYNISSDTVISGSLSHSGTETIGDPLKDLQIAADPLMRYLAINHNPHCIAIISSTSIEVYSGEKSIQNITEHL